MNLVDAISNHLSTDVLGKLGGLIGASETQTKSAATAAVPALLDVFAKLSSSKSGADQLARAIGGLDLSTLGNLSGLLGGGQASNLGSLGGNLLGSLLGGDKGLSSLVNAISSFAGLQPGLMKTLLSYLTPIVLGVVAKQFTGRPDAAGVSRLFSEQSANIRGALPMGLSLGDVLPAVTTGGRQAESHRGREEPAAAALPGWLLPLLALAAIGAGWYLWDQNKKAREADGTVAVIETERTIGPLSVQSEEIVKRQGKDVVDTVIQTMSIDPQFLEAIRVGKNATELFGGLTSVLKGVTDKETAKQALPELKNLAPLLASLEEEAGTLPAEEKPAFATFIGKNLGILSRLIDTVMAIPGVKDVLGPTVTSMMESLTRLAT
jgi:hypothetical protein